MRRDAFKGFAVNHGADVGAELGGVTRGQFRGGTLDHLDHMVGNGLVHTLKRLTQSRLHKLR